MKNIRCLTYATIVNNHDKFSPHAIECVFVEYIENKWSS